MPQEITAQEALDLLKGQGYTDLVLKEAKKDDDEDADDLDEKDQTDADDDKDEDEDDEVDKALALDGLDLSKAGGDTTFADLAEDEDYQEALNAEPVLKATISQLANLGKAVSLLGKGVLKLEDKIDGQNTEVAKSVAAVQTMAKAMGVYVQAPNDPKSVMSKGGDGGVLGRSFDSDSSRAMSKSQIADALTGAITAGKIDGIPAESSAGDMIVSGLLAGASIEEMPPSVQKFVADLTKQE